MPDAYDNALPPRCLVMKRYCLLVLCFLLAPGLVQAQTKDVDPDHAARMARGLEIFKQHVRPVLVQKCLRCHGEKQESNFDLSDRDTLLKGGETGPAILPGNGKKSHLVQLISHAKEPHMPEGRPKLPDEVIAHITTWIDLGAPYDSPLLARKKTGPAWTEKVVTAEDRKHWSLQPLQRVQPPLVKEATWGRTPIDRFVLARLEGAGLRPNPIVERRLLIRRAYFDLLGLPPTPAEVDAFVKDPAPDAWDRLLDRLLDSPHIGERWARHWLDVARFAESHGFEHDYDRPTAYHYRDFVIQAFNNDLPYDQFVKWQLAGDEFAPDENLALMATGFLAAGVHSTQITKREVEKHRYDEMDDMLATTSTAFLGLTVGCARCHDHKFDPIPQADYYRLLSAFTSTVRSEVDLNLDKKTYAVAKAAFDRLHAPYEDAVRRYETEQLPGRFAAWEKAGKATERVPWSLIQPSTLQSTGNATFTHLDDGSYLVSGPNAKFDTWTFVATTDQKGIAAIRLEALTHPSLAKGGPGRAGNGNFALSDLKVTAKPKMGGDPVTVKLKNPRATFEQKGLPIAAVIDSDARSAWAVDPQFGQDHAAIFDFEQPVGFEGGTILTFTLSFRNNDGHNLGRPRLALSTRVNGVGFKDPAATAEVISLLGLDPAKRTPEQAARLLRWFRTTDPEWQRLTAVELEHRRQAPKPRTVKALVSTEGLAAVRLHTQGEDLLPETHFLRRGDPEQKEGIARQGFLQVLSSASEQRWQEKPAAGWRTSYRRRALANWITDTEHGAGHLLARVIVNRLWQHHLGRGLVATPSDFGTRGEPPTHPELLDWLAGELIRNGWRLKPIHKLIMQSAVYQQGSLTDEARLKADRDNRLLWHRPLHRLEAEVIRDSLLAISGQLDAKMFGPGTLDPASKRRSIYFTVKRSKLMPMMQVFDAPEALVSIGDRPTTTIAPQALMLLNNPQIRGQARSFAQRVAAATPQESVRRAYLSALAREPSADEVAAGTAFLEAQTASHSADKREPARELALTDFCQTLMCLNEFVYLQ